MLSDNQRLQIYQAGFLEEMAKAGAHDPSRLLSLGPVQTGAVVGLMGGGLGALGGGVVGALGGLGHHALKSDEEKAEDSYAMAALKGGGFGALGGGALGAAGGVGFGTGMTGGIQAFADSLGIKPNSYVQVFTPPLRKPASLQERAFKIGFEKQAGAMEAAMQGAIPGAAFGGALGIPAGLLYEYLHNPDPTVRAYLESAGIGSMAGLGAGALIGGGSNALRQAISGSEREKIDAGTMGTKVTKKTVTPVKPRRETPEGKSLEKKSLGKTPKEKK